MKATSTAPSLADKGAQLYVARQPILSANEQVFGYELLFRDGVEDYFRHTDADTASRSTLDTSILMGLDVLCDGRRAFLNCTRETLLKDYVTLLPPAQVVVEILESVPVDDLVKAACARLKEAGYTVALDDFVPGDGDSLLGLLGQTDVAPIALGGPWLVPPTPRDFDDPARHQSANLFARLLLRTAVLGVGEVIAKRLSQRDFAAR